MLLKETGLGSDWICVRETFVADGRDLVIAGFPACHAASGMWHGDLLDRQAGFLRDGSAFDASGVSGARWRLSS
jgi:hypothetical protein